MIQKTVKVKSAETLPTKDGKKTYLSVTLTDGNRDNKYSVFDPALQKTLQGAYKSGLSVNVGLEKEGNFWNVKSAEITSADIVQTTQKEAPRQSKSYTADPQKIESIELQNNKNNAVAIYCQVTEKGTPFDGELLGKLFRACQALGADIVQVAKEEYGAVEK